MNASVLKNAITRRTAMGIAGSSATMFTLAMLEPPAAAADPRGVASAATGRIVAKGSNWLRLTTSAGDAAVQLSPGAHAYSGAFGRVSDAEGFIIGDEVVAEGRWEAGTFLAVAVGSLYREVELQVLSLNSDRSIAHTNHGDIDLTSGLVPDDRGEVKSRLQSLATSIRSGDVLQGSGWTDPRNGRRYLLIPAQQIR